MECASCGIRSLELSSTEDKPSENFHHQCLPKPYPAMVTMMIGPTGKQRGEKKGSELNKLLRKRSEYNVTPCIPYCLP